MYLYLGFFNEKRLNSGKFWLAGSYLEPVIEVFSAYKGVRVSDIEGCIGYMVRKAFWEKPCYALRVNGIEFNEKSIVVDYSIDFALETTSGDVRRRLYRCGRVSGWIKGQNGFVPLLCVVDQETFDVVRLGTPRLTRDSNLAAQIENYKRNNDWDGICSLFEPLEEVRNRPEWWNNPYIMSDLAFACSKKGEPSNEKKRDMEHLKEVKRFRDLSIEFFGRCIDLQPSDPKHPSSLAYRYYLNYWELERKVRKDGKASDEMEKALTWFKKALELDPRRIKDHYRMGRLIERKIENKQYAFRKTEADGSSLRELETEFREHLVFVIREFERMNEETRKRFFKEYVKSIYSLSCHYFDKTSPFWDEYVCRKIRGINPRIQVSRDDLDNLRQAEALLHKCGRVQIGPSWAEDIDLGQAVSNQGNWKISPVYLLYRSGLLNTRHYLYKVLQGCRGEEAEIYRRRAEKCLLAARDLSVKLNGRPPWYIKEKIARLYILSGRYDDALAYLKGAQDAWVLKTLGTVWLLKGAKYAANAEKAFLQVLKKDRAGTQKNNTVPLLIYAYHLQNKRAEIKRLLREEASSLTSEKSRKCLLSLGVYGNEIRPA